MDKVTKNSKELRKFWSEKLAQWQLSGKNGSQWCKEQKLSYQCFTYWKKVLLGPCIPHTKFTKKRSLNLRVAQVQ